CARCFGVLLPYFDYW
nr:immunoglobulin heavy chain junction region [Macaca mulatta]MOX92431.1 immunoglobulin heavy chain junction region [Macaca mulatta]MOX92449.1 immunoglobulin heavy chain junction region [Macaca mulatta]MOX93601.1 immunoglobulin heavy chain junction region [Macaca mulatta]MOX93706.1 immunoglobulin heavy chain junction region [Macaca mulatta]